MNEVIEYVASLWAGAGLLMFSHTALGQWTGLALVAYSIIAPNVVAFLSLKNNK